MEYYSELKRNEPPSHEKTWRKQMHIAKLKKPIQKGYIIYDCNHINSGKDKTFKAVKRLGEGEEG